MKYWGGGERAVEEISTGEGARQIFGFGFDAMSCVPCHGFIFATHWYCTVPVSVWASSGHTFCEFSSAFVTNAHVFVSHFSETFFTQKSYLCWCLVDLIAQCVSGITSNRSRGADGSVTMTLHRKQHFTRYHQCYHPKQQNLRLTTAGISYEDKWNPMRRNFGIAVGFSTTTTTTTTTTTKQATERLPHINWPVVCWLSLKRFELFHKLMVTVHVFNWKSNDLIRTSTVDII